MENDECVEVRTPKSKKRKSVKPTGETTPEPVVSAKQSRKRTREETEEVEEEASHSVNDVPAPKTPKTPSRKRRRKMTQPITEEELDAAQVCKV